MARQRLCLCLCRLTGITGSNATEQRVSHWPNKASIRPCMRGKYEYIWGPRISFQNQVRSQEAVVFGSGPSILDRQACGENVLRKTWHCARSCLVSPVWGFTQRAQALPGTPSTDIGLLSVVTLFNLPEESKRVSSP